MALIKCPECGHDVSDKAESCPNCGYGILIKGNEGDNSDKQQVFQNDSSWVKANQRQPQTLPEKPKKKKHGCLISIVVFFLFCALVSSLGDSDDRGKDESTNTTAVQQESGGEKGNQQKQTAVKEEKTAFKSKTIYKEHNCKLDLISGDDKGFSIQIKNNSKKDYSFDIHSMSINGIMTNCNIYTGGTSVPSKKKGVMSIDFENGWLSGIKNVEYVDMVIWAYDDAKSFKDFETKLIRLKTNHFKKEKKFKTNKGAVKDKGLVIQKEKLNTETFEFSVINKNKEYVEFDFENSSINGWAFEDDYLFDAKDVCVFPNSKTTIKLDISDFTENSKIKKINDIEFSLAVRSKGDYFKEKRTKKIKFK